MCSLFGLIDFRVPQHRTHTKNKILDTLARMPRCMARTSNRHTYNFNDRLRIYKRPARLLGR